MSVSSEINRRSLLKRSAGAMALAMGGGTHFLSSSAAYAQSTALASEQLRTIGLSVTVQERILADFKKASGVGSTSGTAATFPDAQTKILSGSKDYDVWETIGERLPSVVMTLSDWQGSSFLLSTRTGKTEMVEDLGHLWPLAEKISGRVCDPLSRSLIDKLEGGGNA